MKDNILKIDLGTQTSPVIQETRGKDWIEFSGSDGWKNTYPQFIIDLYNKNRVQLEFWSNPEVVSIKPQKVPPPKTKPNNYNLFS